MFKENLGGRTFHAEDNNRKRDLPSYSLCNPQFQSVKLALGHALQGHRCGQIQSRNVLDLAAAFYLATKFLHFWINAHLQKHFIRIGDGQCLFNQAVLNQDAMIRRYCQRRRMGRRNALVLLWMFHCIYADRFSRCGHSFGPHGDAGEFLRYIREDKCECLALARYLEWELERTIMAKELRENPN